MATGGATPSGARRTRYTGNRIFLAEAGWIARKNRRHFAFRLRIKERLSTEGPFDQDITELAEDLVSAGLAQRLEKANMATALYACGTEAFLSRIRRVALESDFPKENLFTQVAGPNEWDVQCAYCKRIHANTTRRTIRCENCGIDLLVRNHYSISFGAYQGVFISPGDPIFAEASQAELV
ncbi:dimethylamine monooxygenase subunit DmmA family protein [Agrobacterium sp. T29]|uniref:dimethylamine monooxygenase subunit DmmA family protein n=1 Tax=Agrobacterium sp. T29 TaxID=2580515 RepID=UPI00115DB4DD|nr:dimethylamine monooxygenase subunit DmmA family protein [Agrobacterium sp. T29]